LFGVPSGVRPSPSFPVQSSVAQAIALNLLKNLALWL
jgi:hypothetical protein